jgi:molybdenum cofactor synthesis domain-containing protein
VAILQTLKESAFEAETTTWQAWLQGTSLAWITLSDAGHQGCRRDESGPQIPKLVKAELDLSLDQGFVLPDDLPSLKGLISHLALNQGFDLIVTTGGTGVTSRDITPEATLSLVERRLPGFEQAMLTASMATTHHGLISRAVAGILHRTLIVNLPGSPKAVAENLAPLLPALRHCLDKIHDDPRDCASS